MLGSEFRPFGAVHPASRESVGADLVRLTGNQPIGTTFSTAWPTANLAFYIPFSLAVAARVRQLGVMNGATVSGNFDVGIYSAGGEKLVSSGPTAQSGTSAIQLVNITDVNLPAGDYYLALVLDNTTGTVHSNNSHIVAYLAAVGMLQQASAFPLPSSMTGVAPTNQRVFFPLALFGRIF